MELQVKQADFSENGLSQELVPLSVDKVYENVICNYNTEGTAMTLNGFNTWFIKIPKDITTFYFSGLVKKKFGLSLVKTVDLTGALPTYITVPVDNTRFIIRPSGSNTEETFEDEEIDISEFPTAEYFMYSMDTAYFEDAHLDYLF